MTTASDKAARRQARKQDREARRAEQARALNPEKKPLEAKNPRQRKLIDACRSAPQVMALGPAGTGKTFLASAVASDKLLDQKIERIVLCRPAVGAEEDIGFLPGSMSKKMAPWTAPFMDVFKERLGVVALNKKLELGEIEIVPLAFMRGRTFHNAFIILDEAQNATLSQLKMVLTRIGENSTMVVTGDVTQSDIGVKSGLATVAHMARDYELPIKLIEFQKEDVVRSDSCRVWTEAFDRFESRGFDAPVLRIEG